MPRRRAVLVAGAPTAGPLAQLDAGQRLVALALLLFALALVLVAARSASGAYDLNHDGLSLGQ